ncbi:MAG: hypothetical protein HYT16_02715 [DPANN group archaeon]|nr:hypothetical protein [DPANN group archaeon]
MHTLRLPKMTPKLWNAEPCPACSSSDVRVDWETGELVCLKCGLVVY